MLWIFAYRLFLILLLPIMFIRLWLKGRKEPLYRKRWSERLGFLSIARQNNKPLIWLHCVSVGEFLASIPLIDTILAANTHQLLITSTTPSGSEQILKKYHNKVLHTYLPVDFSIFYRQILTKLQPKICVIIETEVWVNLINTLHKHQIPTILANARLSEKSFLGYQKMAKLSRPTLKKISHITAQSQQSYDYFLKLGVEKNQISQPGNIKFDLNLDTSPALLDEFRRLFNQRPVLLFASTHPGEEALILSEYNKHKNDFDNALMVIVPRHPNRCDEVGKLLNQQQLSYKKRSQNIACDATTDVLLVDTMGELTACYALADWCFIGGSLVKHGGHNMLEPAGLKKPILFGLWVHNFPEITCQLLEHKGAIQVQDAKDLFGQLKILLQNPEQCQQLGDNAYNYFSQNQGATQILFERIRQV